MFSSSGSFCSPSAPRWFPSESVLFQEISMNKLVAGRATSIFHLCAVAKFAGDSSQPSPKVAPSCRTSTLSKENSRSLRSITWILLILQQNYQMDRYTSRKATGSKRPMMVATTIRCIDSGDGDPL